MLRHARRSIRRPLGRTPFSRTHLSRTALTRTVRRTAAALVAVALVSSMWAPAPARAANPVTPGDFAGFGFDQCVTPTQSTMNTWLNQSPFLAVGIYISGTSRACRDQPNLTPTWVSTQLRKGWRLLPITLGPQASCQPRFPRYKDDVRINPTPGPKNGYSPAVRMGRAEASTTVADAQKLGITPGSTLWYDMEGYNSTNTHCRESALAFLSGWTERLHKLGYVSGVYSSAGSGIADLDKARISRPTKFNLPDAIWVARWDGIANTSTSYIKEDGWRPGGRVKQYLGGHNETWGGVTINIDSNWLDVGRGTVAGPENRCNNTRVSFPRYPALPRGKGAPARIVALKCLLKDAGHFNRPLNGNHNAALTQAIRSYQAKNGFGVRTTWTVKNWVSLLSQGAKPALKRGSTGDAVRRLQRSLNAAVPSHWAPVNGVFGATTDRAVRAYQRQVGIRISGVANPGTWRHLDAGVR